MPDEKYFPSEILQELVWSPLHVEFDLEGARYKVVQREIVDRGRWSVYSDMVFSADGDFWKVTYSDGATEYQDEAPFGEYDEYEVLPVKPVEKVVIVYVPV